MVVTALDKNDEFLNFLNMIATAVGPDMKPIAHADRADLARPLRRHAPRPRRRQLLPDDQSRGGPGPDPRGVTVPYSDEFRERTPNDALLNQLAAIVPKGGHPGIVIEMPDHVEKTLPAKAPNPYRHDLPKATSSQDAWHYFLLMACCLLFADVFWRRVHVNFNWVPPLALRARDWVLRRTPKPAAPEFIERLRSRKEEVSGQLDQLGAAARFEPTTLTPPAPTC